MPTFGERWKFFWTAHDPDDVFAYDTLKFVTIRDRYLGMLHHSFQLAILVYVIGIVIFYQKQFLRREVPDGLIRLAVINGDGVDQTAIQHCNSVFSQGPPYCTFPTQDEITTGGGSSMLHLASYYTATDYGKTCTDTINCVSNITSGPTSYVVGNFDKFSISIDHSFQTAKGITLGDFTPKGFLKSPKKTQDGRSYKNTLKEFNSLSSDILPVPELLAATNEKGKPFNMDAVANEYLNVNNDPAFVKKSYREFGVVVLLVVDYSNIENYWQGCQRDKNPCFQYSYELAAIPSIEDYAQDTIYTVYPTNRTTLDKRGIRIIGVMTGEIGSFNFQVLLVQLTTSLALIKVATTVVDQIAIRLLPRKAAYREAKYERTEDFSDKFKREKELKKSKSVELDTMGSDGSASPTL